jgi:hypothetical protein
MSRGCRVRWSASGRRGAEADDARTREVGPRHSSCEAGEQSGCERCGVGGAKDGDQGECGPAKHAPDSELGTRVTGAGSHTATPAQRSLCRHSPEVGAVCGKTARTDLGGGRAMKRTSLPLQQQAFSGGLHTWQRWLRAHVGSASANRKFTDLSPSCCLLPSPRLRVSAFAWVRQCRRSQTIMS